MMRRIIFLVMLFCSFNSLVAQDEPQENQTFSIGTPTNEQTDTIRTENGTVVEFNLEKGEKNSNIIREKFIFGLGVNSVMSNGSFDLPNTSVYNDWDLRVMKSTNVYLGLVHYKLNMADKKLFLHTGLDLDFKKFMFENDFVIDKDADTWQTIAIPSNVKTKKNKFSATYLELPLMLNYESNSTKRESFSVNAGGYVGLRLASRQKIKFKDKDDNVYSSKNKKRYKERDPFNLNTVTYGLEGQIGYGGVHLYTKYSLQDLFEDQVGNPELQPLSIGILINPF